MLYRIKIGTKVQLQGKEVEWPLSAATARTEFKADLVTGKTYSLRALGFGLLGQGDDAFGRGPIVIHGMDGIEGVGYARNY